MQSRKPRINDQSIRKIIAFCSWERCKGLAHYHQGVLKAKDQLPVHKCGMLNFVTGFEIAATMKFGAT